MPCQADCLITFVKMYYVAHKKISCQHSDLVSFPKPIIYKSILCPLPLVFLYLSGHAQTLVGSVHARVAGSALRSITGELNNQSVHSMYERLAQLQSGLGKPCVCERWGSPYGGRKMHSGGTRYECIASGQFKNAAINI